MTFFSRSFAIPTLIVATALSRPTFLRPAFSSPPFPPSLSKAPAEENKTSSLPSAASMIAPNVGKLEDEIAQLEPKRDTTAPALLPWIDLQIDSRILSRWLLTQATVGKEESTLQIEAYLHGMSMLALVPVIDDFASKQTAGPSNVQTVGTGRIHQLTFQLKDAKDGAALDAASADVAQDILIAITPMRGGERLPPLVPMRPASAAATSPGEVASEPAGTKSLDQLAASARQASVSPPLRRQLIAIASLAQQAQADPAQKDDAETLRNELANALELTQGLQTNTAVTPEERGQIESQLCEGLALFSDPRMRPAATARLASLDQYRQLLARVEKMRLPPELKDALAPALAWAHQNPEQGDKVLAAVEKFVALYLRDAARPAQPTEFVSLRPNAPLRRAYQEIGQQFVKERGDFLGDAANLKTGDDTAAAGGTSTDSNMITTASKPGELDDRVDKMTHLEDVLDVLAAMPKTLQVLDTYRPRPSGELDRRANSLIVAIESPLSSPARDEALRQLIQLHGLSARAQALQNLTITSIPPAVAQSYAGGQIDALQTKWKSMVTELASSFAANQPMDKSRLDRLKIAEELLNALGPATDLESAFAKPDALANWADWTITPDQFHNLLAPYQHAMSDAFKNLVADNPDTQLEFVRLLPQYKPLIAMLARTGGYADECAALPGGTPGMLSRLATPYEKAPFGEQRFASFITAPSALEDGDPSITEAAVLAISDHVRR